MLHYFTAVPVPLPSVAEIMTQIEKQGWTVRFVVFSGMVVLTPSIATPGKTPPMPSYMIIACQEAIDGTRPEAPKIEGMR